MPLLSRIAGFAARHDMFLHGARIGIAVSGGADSVFLLHALRELAPRWNLALSVVHIEHGIRGAASLADAEFVRKPRGLLRPPVPSPHAPTSPPTPATWSRPRAAPARPSIVS